jgi:hypothetical protein
MRFYEFLQNNSGGSFQTDEQLTHRVIIEAKDEKAACSIAENMGVYFNGVEEGSDCPCCGDRWCTPSEVRLKWEGFDEPDANRIAEDYRGSAVLREGKIRKGMTHDVVFPDVEAYAQFMSDRYGWCKPDARVFYHDGRVTEIFRKDIVLK